MVFEAVHGYCYGGKNTASTSYIPLLIILFSSLQSLLNYTATYLNTWVGQKISQGLKITLFEKLMRYDAGFLTNQLQGIFFSALIMMLIWPVPGCCLI